MTLAAFNDFTNVRFVPDRPQLKDTMKIGMPLTRQSEKNSGLLSKYQATLFVSGRFFISLRQKKAAPAPSQMQICFHDSGGRYKSSSAKRPRLSTRRPRLRKSAEAAGTQSSSLNSRAAAS
jgi:hypothetical protein